MWELGAPDCNGNSIEIRTYGILEEAGRTTRAPDFEAAFAVIIN